MSEWGKGYMIGLTVGIVGMILGYFIARAGA